MYINSAAWQVRDLGYAFAARATQVSVALAKKGYAAYSGNSMETSIARALEQYLVLEMDLSSISGPIKTRISGVTFTDLVHSLHSNQPTEQFAHIHDPHFFRLHRRRPKL